MYLSLYTATPSESAAEGFSPIERSRSPNGVRHSTYAEMGIMLSARMVVKARLVVNPRPRPAASEMRNHRLWSSQPNTSGVFQPNRVPPARNGNVKRGIDPDMVGRLRDRPVLVALEHGAGQEAAHTRREQVDGYASDDVVNAERHGGQGEKQPAQRAADRAGDDCRPRAPLPAGPAREPGPEDHHALEADVHHADPLGEEAAQRREDDR